MPCYSLRTLLIALAVGPLALALFLSWDRINGTNCGGNNAALSDVRAYAIFIQCAANESKDGVFLVTSATPKQRKQLAEIAHDPWLRGGQLLVSKVPYRLQTTEPRRIVAVCDRPFTNVPRHVFGEAPPTHAVGFSDGSSSLLTSREFAGLDRSSLVPLNEVIEQLSMSAEISRRYGVERAVAFYEIGHRGQT